MAYLTAAELRDRTSNLELAQVATPREVRPISAADMAAVIDGGTPTDPTNAALALAKINKALADAGDLVDNFLRGRYSLPLSVTPQTIAEIVVRLARYGLHNERATDEIVERYKEAMQWLRAIATGDMVLEVGPTDTRDTGLPAVSEGSGLYSVEGLRDYACPYRL